MSAERLNAELKTRVPKRYKRELEAIAIERHLTVADVARQALREFLVKHSPEAPANEKAVAA